MIEPISLHDAVFSLNFRRYAVVEELAGLGATVHTCSRNEAELDKCLREWHAKGFSVTASICDGSDRAQREKLMEKVSSIFNGKLNILVSMHYTSRVLIFFCFYSGWLFGFWFVELKFNLNFETCLFVKRLYRGFWIRTFELKIDLCGGSICMEMGRTSGSHLVERLRQRLIRGRGNRNGNRNCQGMKVSHDNRQKRVMKILKRLGFYFYINEFSTHLKIFSISVLSSHAWREVSVWKLLYII